MRVGISRFSLKLAYSKRASIARQAIWSYFRISSGYLGGRHQCRLMAQIIPQHCFLHFSLYGGESWYRKIVSLAGRYVGSELCGGDCGLTQQIVTQRVRRGCL